MHQTAPDNSTPQLSIASRWQMPSCKHSWSLDASKLHWLVETTPPSRNLLGSLTKWDEKWTMMPTSLFLRTIRDLNSRAIRFGTIRICDLKDIGPKNPPSPESVTCRCPVNRNVKSRIHWAVIGHFPSRQGRCGQPASEVNKVLPWHAIHQ
jgi:hypothetical protein